MLKLTQNRHNNRRSLAETLEKQVIDLRCFNNIHTEASFGKVSEKWYIHGISPTNYLEL